MNLKQKENALRRQGKSKCKVQVKPWGQGIPKLATTARRVIGLALPFMNYRLPVTVGCRNSSVQGARPEQKIGTRSVLFRASTNAWGGGGRLIVGLKVPVLKARAAGLNRMPHNHVGCQHGTLRAVDHHPSAFRACDLRGGEQRKTWWEM